MQSEIRRTHDKEVYLLESRYHDPKEIHKLIAARILKSGVLRTGSIVCDLGCAGGEYLFYLSRLFPYAKYCGYDVVPQLIEKASAMVPGVSFFSGSVLDEALLSPSSVDIACLTGVLPIFDDFNPCLSNLIKWTRAGGRIYIFSLFNPHPVDVWVKYRRADDPDSTHLEPGWNIFSKVSISRYLDSAIGAGKHTYYPFDLPFDLPPHPDDPIRTWTFLDAQNRRMFTNGLSLICNMELLEISL